MKKYILGLIALVAFTITASAQYFVAPLTTNGAGTLSIISGAGIADNTTTNIPQAINVSNVVAGVGKSAPIYLNPDGSFPASAALLVSITGTNAGATNVFTLTFVPDYASTGGGTNISTRVSQAVTLMAGGLGTACVSSNLASSVFGTASGVRLQSIAVADDAGSFGGYTVRVGVTGWKR